MLRINQLSAMASSKQLEARSASTHFETRPERSARYAPLAHKLLLMISSLLYRTMFLVTVQPAQSLLSRFIPFTPPDTRQQRRPHLLPTAARACHEARAQAIFTFLFQLRSLARPGNSPRAHRCPRGVHLWAATRHAASLFRVHVCIKRDASIAPRSPRY